MKVEHRLSADPFSDIERPPEKMWPGLLATGIFTMVLGIAAVLLPFIAALTIQALLAAIFIIAGIVHVIHAFQFRQSKGLAWRLLTGALYALVGILLVAYPLQGVLTLTILLAVLFMFSGVFKIVLSLHLRPGSSWGWLMFNGIVSVLLGVLIWAGLPGTARWAIGLLVGIELLFTGWAMIMFSMSIRHPEKKAAEGGE
jgi:uncharacterized membrane protein HdeD (DUF308 family)